MARVEMALRRESDGTAQEISATGAGAGAVSRVVDLDAGTAEEALLHRRLRLLHMHLTFFEAVANGDYEGLKSWQQEFQEELSGDEERIGQIVPSAGNS